MLKQKTQIICTLYMYTVLKIFIAGKKLVIFKC